MLISHVTNASRVLVQSQFHLSVSNHYLLVGSPTDAMIESFELAAEYSAIRDKPDNYDVPHEDDFSDKDPNDLLEGQLSC